MEALKDWFSYVRDNWEYIQESIIQHLRMVAIVMAFATAFSLTVGIVVQRWPTVRALTQSAFGIFLTIPSLALFAIFIPLLGTGNRPAMLALFLYALLPILRNTVTGLDAVSPAVVESAQGMGMGALGRLFRVRLPLAWPIIMAGIRVSTLMTVGIAAIAPLVGGDGLGTWIQGGLTRLGLPNAANSVWVGVVFTVLVGLVLDIVLATAQRLTTPRGLRA